MRRLTDFFRRLFRRPAKKEEVSVTEQGTLQGMEHSIAQHDTVQHSEPMVSRATTQQRRDTPLPPRRSVVVKHAGSQAGRQDVGRFMKHGKQLPHYRKSVKAKIQPEKEDEDEDYSFSD